MSSEDFGAALREVAETLGQEQAFSLANSYILMEIVRALALASPDPHKYLADMFERVSFRADQGPIDGESHPVTAQFREAIAQFFSKAGHQLRRQD
jgi:hypothetical protein